MRKKFFLWLHFVVIVGFLQAPLQLAGMDSCELAQLVWAWTHGLSQSRKTLCSSCLGSQFKEHMG